MGLASSPSPSESPFRHYYGRRVLPPNKSAQDRRDVVTYLSDIIDIFHFRYSDCGIVFLGDFNGLDTSDLLSSHGLKQLVSNPTRVCATLDLILSNLQPF